MGSSVCLERFAKWLSACLLALGGCIIPTPLEVEGTAGLNVPPQIVSGEPVDFFPPVLYTPGNPSDPWAFQITVRDPDATARNETLYANLYSVSPANELGYISDFKITPSASDATLFTGTSATAAYCKFPDLADPALFYVFVSDGPFPVSGNLRDLKAGTFDYKNWVVKCR